MGFSKRLDEARKAFKKGDPKAAAVAHDPRRIAQSASERHGGGGSQYLGEMVYGGLDGIITTFAVVSGVAGADLGVKVVLIMGLANLFADGFSMATGAYLSSKSEQEYYHREKQRESWEVEHFPDGERTELYQLYLSQGYSEEDARKLVEIKTKDSQRWVKSMMVEELGMMEDERNPLVTALATFAAFLTAGSVPMLIYLLGLLVPIPSAVSFPIALFLSVGALFGLGAAKVLVTERNAWRSGLEMLAVGGLAAAVAYLVGAALKGIGG